MAIFCSSISLNDERVLHSSCPFPFATLNQDSTFVFPLPSSPSSPPFPRPSSLPLLSFSVSYSLLSLLLLPSTSNNNSTLSKYLELCNTNNQIFIHLWIHVYVDIVKVLIDKKRLIFWVCIEIRMFSCNHLLSHSCHSFPTMAFCHHDVGSSP